ncbi:Exocyst complex component SEC8 [Nakaseomyces bracarensis]|uniref:Exocyst complex component Sec8 n=1 Tax=Nakaseomyces bracarensis TaxID=273131 RepID=A0ABR4NMF6_9SACH
MDHLGVSTKGRRRALSVNSYSEDQQNAMDNALDNLKSDLSLVKSQWSRVLTNESIPLELALSFLDDTSVGLGHRYTEFNQLKDQIGRHLQEVVNEHSQAFNANVASYSQAVNAITKAQDKSLELRESVKVANGKITGKKGDLGDLNEQSLKYNEMIEDLNSIEKLIQLPEKIEESIRDKDYKNAQRLLDHGLQLINTPNLKAIPSIQPLNQQLELQEHVLFSTLIEEIHNIIYSKKDDAIINNQIYKIVGISQNQMSTLENYVYNVVNIDIKRQSKYMNEKLELFLQDIKEPNAYSENVMIRNSKTAFDELFIYLSILKDMKKLPTAINIIADRSKEEFHNIILKATEKVRAKHPSLLKMTKGFDKEISYGLSIKDLLSMIMRECFWEISIKFVIATQGHRVVSEAVNFLQVAGSKVIYPFEKIWAKILDEIDVLMSKYLKNEKLLNSSKNSRTRGSRTSSILAKNNEVFLLESNIEDESNAKDHAVELKTLLKDIFPGFTVSANMDLGSIYIKDESFKRDDALIPPSIFNIKVLLEPFLLYTNSAEAIIPDFVGPKIQKPLEFFESYLTNQFSPNIELTFNSLFETYIDKTNPYALETLEDGKLIFKAAVDFQSMLYKIMNIMNTTNSFRRNISASILEIIIRFQVYYADLFNSVLSNSSNDINGNILMTWLDDQKLLHIEDKIYNGDETVIEQETEELLKYIPRFCERGRGLTNHDVFGPATMDIVIHFLATVIWILDWLPLLKKKVGDDNCEKNKQEVDSLRHQWSFFETIDMELNQFGSLKFSLDSEFEEKFDEAIYGFMNIKSKLVSLLRFDVRSVCVLQIGELFQHTRLWNPEDSSNEIDQSISSLISKLRVSENKLRQHISDIEIKTIFSGVDIMCNHAFIDGSKTIEILNRNGIKKISRNINVLQHTFRNLSSEPEKVNMSDTLNYYALCGADEGALFDQISSGVLSNYSLDNLKNILRLQFSEEIARQMKRTSKMSTKMHSKPTNKRYQDAMEKLNSLASNKGDVSAQTKVPLDVGNSEQEQAISASPTKASATSKIKQMLASDSTEN